VFAAKPGNYAIGVQQMVEQSRDAQDGPDALARQYLRYMNFAYSAEGWGASAPDALASHLASNEAVLFSRTSTLYGALDNDDTYQYAGGLTAGRRRASGCTTCAAPARRIPWMPARGWPRS
jgi:cobaltochelatase CobN